MLKKIYSFGVSHVRWMLLLFVLIFVSLLLSKDTIRLVMLILAITIGSLSKLYHRFYKSSIGIDFIFIPTILLAREYGFIFGIVSAFVALLIADFLATKISHYSLVSLIGYTAISTISALLYFAPVFVVGIICLLIYEMITIFLYWKMGSSISRISLFLITHFLFNITLLSLL